MRTRTMRNLGNTCFAAAAVWALRACPRARAYVRQSGREVARLLARVMDDPSSGAWPALVRALGAIVERRGREPHDSHELLCRLVNELGMDARFRVHLVTRIRCMSCGHAVTVRDSNIFVVAEPSYSVVTGLASAQTKRLVEDRDCDEGCRARCRAEIRTVPRKPAPDALMVRVSCDRSGVWVEHALEYCGNRYRVKSVIIYKGDGRGGHYVCGVLTSGGWIVHDDDEARRADEVKTVADSSLFRDAHTVLYEKE